MDYLQIKGEAKLSGSVEISGSKNAALPLIALSLIFEDDFKITNLPDVADINTLLLLLSNLGAKIEKKEHSATINTNNINSTKANYDIVRKMRASILVLGPLLARFKRCEVSLPGGCAIGARPIDLHLSALEKMGAKIEIKEGYVVATAPNGLVGATINFDKITVTGTENIIMAAALAKGKTKIISAAREPEIVALCEALKEAGVQIDGCGTSVLTIEGTNGKLLKTDKKIVVIPDRIEAGTYLCAGAITNSNITIKKCEPKHISAVIAKFEEMGFGFLIDKDSITIKKAQKLKPVEIVTKEYPAFPTDMQAQFMAVCTTINGASIIEETLFENRFMHVGELLRMGAQIKLSGHIATISGSKLFGTDVMATDLRASSALVLAALVAKGTTKVHRIYHLDRGYENLEGKLRLLGVEIERLKERG
ncbi:UDP-N-acetylglucosamine 1-carboxyvinyltransferase [uncultured Campylobacter sp.]|uniref:UDP-N-acetylglucosamine 1-carboxyvinyltransferase n=1 Tax=uncultured Campylobacter sp. TaxID=218934 RepID=UPI0026339A96|nr:UDP-N-acetylglucosamine 1-carboxyvinyltransferase [uncultured Campylobacter sp.]